MSKQESPKVVNKTKQKNGGNPKKNKKELRILKREQERLQAIKDTIVYLTKEDIKSGKPFYGHYPLIQSTELNTTVYTNIKDLDVPMDGKDIVVRARIHNSRKQAKGIFMVLRQGYCTIQGTIFGAKKLVKYCQNLSKESIVDVYGKIVKVENPVTSTSQQNVEINVSKIFCIVPAISPMPLLVEDSMVPEPEKKKEGEGKKEDKKKKKGAKGKKAVVGQDVRLDNRVIDLRAPANLAIFRIQNHIGRLFREHLYKKDFTEIHTPKLIGTASEGGADVFKLGYFDTHAYLAQSPQLYKQMAVQGDLMKVFEIGPVFRAENSHTHRHLTEFVGCDIEMEIKSHYSEVLDVLDGLFIYIFDTLQTKFKKELEIISKQYPFSPFKFNKKKNLRLSYPQAIELLRTEGKIKIGDLDDITTTQEKLLGSIVLKKYGTDFFFLDKFPLKKRPFYTMPCPNNKDYSNSYDLFVRGEEIASGAQRVHDVDLLKTRGKVLGVDLTPIQGYVDSFKYGAWPHGGAGIGLERVAMLFLGLKNIRKTSMFPRDPKRLSP